MLNIAELKAFELNGYHVIDNLLSTKLLEQTREAFDRLESYRNLIDLDGFFLQIASHSDLYSVIASILNSPPQLLQFDGINRQQGQGDQTWHADFFFYCDRPLMLNVGIYLDDLELSNGPLYVVPKSHHFGQPPPSNSDHLSNQLSLTVSAGSAVIFDCALWHRGGGNVSDQPRRAIFPTYGHYWMKRFESWMPEPTSTRFPNADTAELRTLLGISLEEPSAYSGYDEKLIVRKDSDGNWI